MHRATLLPVIIIAAVVVGGLLYLYGGPAFHQTYQATQSPTPSAPTVTGSRSTLTVIAQGANATNIDDRVNYRITTEDQLAALWQDIYTDNGSSVPTIDFSKYEVFALFDGSHSTDGYGIEVASVKDTSDARIVTIVHREPGDSCVPSGAGSSPYVIVKIDRSALPISRVDQTVTTQCE